MALEIMAIIIIGSGFILVDKQSIKRVLKPKEIVTELQSCVKCDKTNCWAVPIIRNNVLRGFD